MKSYQWKKAVFLFVLSILVPVFWIQGSTTVKAATTKFTKANVEIEGIGEVYQLKLANKQANSTYRWSSSNKKVATVTNSGLVSTVNKGTTTIKCKVTYQSGTVLNLSCTVTVTIPATDIEINNTTLVNGSHVMLVGDTYNFNRTITPSNSSDKTYWSLDASDDDANPNAVRIDNKTNGMVTALRRGKIVLVATAAKSATAKSAANSDIKDAIIIEVVGPSAEVISAEITGAKKIRVEFGTEIKESTVVTSSGNLSSNITVAQLNDKTGNRADDPGNLTAILSGNQKVLTITSANNFNGTYSITFSRSILTSEGVPIYNGYFELNYTSQTATDDTGSTDTSTDTSEDTTTDTDGTVTDTEAPKLVSTVLDGSGMTTVLTFSEKMDFSKLSAYDAKALSSSTEVQASTLNFLNTASNYTYSSDGKSLYINLSGISTVDYNKSFLVTLSGLTDTAGNKITAGSLMVTVRTDNTPYAQARPVSVVRSSYNTITATFSRSIRTPGYATVNGGGSFYGVVSADDNKQVIYTLPDYYASLVGNQIISIGYWDSYNVVSTDNYAKQMYSFTVYFETESTRPYLKSYTYDSSLSILTLTYSENVKLVSDSGLLPYTFISLQYGNISNYCNYTKLGTSNNVIEITLKNITLYGDYTITLPESFVIDNYRNLGISSSLTINNGSGTTTVSKLTEPYSVYQSDVNHSFIYIEFADKLDEATALDINHYSVSGATIEEVVLVSNTASGATVRLNVGKGTLTASGTHNITVTGIKGYNGASSEMADYTIQLNLIENVDPELKTLTYDATAKNAIKLTFTEAIKGSIVAIVQERSTGNIISNTVSVAGDTATITLGSTPADGTYLTIYVQTNSITDTNGNESIISPVMNAFVNY